MRRNILKANVVLPSDVSREKYVEYCLMTHTVAVQTENGEFIKNCPVAYNFCGVNEGFLFSLEIPKETGKLGSRVLLIYSKEYDLAVVIGCLQDGKNIRLDEEHQMKLIRRTNGNSFMVRGSGLKGIVDIIASSTSSEGGKINLKAFNNEGTGSMDFQTSYFTVRAKERMRVYGNKLIDIYLQNKAVQDGLSFISWELGVGFRFEDEFENVLLINEDGYSFTDKDGGTFKLKGGIVELNGNGESAVKGDTLQTQLNLEKARLTALIVNLAAITVVAGSNGLAAITAAMAPYETGSYENILSTKVKLD